MAEALLLHPSCQLCLGPGFGHCSELAPYHKTRNRVPRLCPIAAYPYQPAKCSALSQMASMQTVSPWSGVGFSGGPCWGGCGGRLRARPLLWCTCTNILLVSPPSLVREEWDSSLHFKMQNHSLTSMESVAWCKNHFRDSDFN